MDWPETFELTLDGIAQGGEGVGRWHERVVFAAGGLPGERVRVRLHERHPAFARGAVVEVLEASPDRVAPRLPEADWMPWQHIAYPAQLRFKRQILAEQLAKIGDLAGVTVGETLPSAREWGYRSSARLHIQGARLGYYGAGTRDLHAVEADPLLLPVLNEALAGLRQTLGTGGVGRCEVVLRASESYGYLLAALHSGDRADGAALELRALAARWRAACPALAGVLVRGQPSAQLGADHLIEELGGIAFRLQPTTFFQVNRASAETLLQLARQGLHLRFDQRLLDLYCGAGAFTLPLAAEVAEAVGVEEHAGAVADAQATAAENGIANARFEVGTVERVLERLAGPFEAVLIDPPRRGCHPQALAALLRLAPARIVYISCHPATLARDLKTLAAGGYAVSAVQPVDLFPQTPHIESVSVLTRPNPSTS
jgi:23S rRNA (uracil1939-C5)-methyltransferase